MGELGYHNSGANSSSTINGYVMASHDTMPDETGIVSSFSLRGLSAGGAGVGLRFGLYADVAGTPGALLDYTAIYYPPNQSDAWLPAQDALIGYSLEASTKYWLAVLRTTAGTPGFKYKWSSATEYQKGLINGGTMFNDPWSGTSPFNQDKRMSFYLTYAPGHVTNPGGDINWAHTKGRQ